MGSVPVCNGVCPRVLKIGETARFAQFLGRKDESAD